jgi:hypothetical protein
MKKQYSIMASFNYLKKNRIFLFTISLILTILITPVLTTSNKITLTKDEGSTEGFDLQIPSESYVYYENTAGDARSVYVSGDYAYVADETFGLAIIDISDPTNPGIPVYVDTTGGADGVYVSGDYAYVADGGSGLAIIDISDPTNPGTPIYEDTSLSSMDVFVSGDYAYAAHYTNGFAIFDISDPTNPVLVGFKNTNGQCLGVYVSGDYAYVADGHFGLVVIDISDPTNPGTPVYENTNGVARDVYVSGDYAYIADGINYGLAVIDISDPTNPGTPVYVDTTGDARGVYVSGDYAYVADDISGLAVIDISDPTNPGTPVYEDTTGSAYGVYVSGNYAYVADGGSGLAVIDISEQFNPEVTYEDTTQEARGVYVSGDNAYVADYGYGSGLAIIDISDPVNPGTPVYVDTADDACGVVVSGDYAYVADGDSGLAIIDISDPTNPGLPVYEDTTGDARGVYVSGNYAYVADYGSGLAIIDISDPVNPGTPVYADTMGYAKNVYVSGDYAYVADWTSGLAVFDISNPTNPGSPVYENTNGQAHDVYVSGDYAYVADGTSGLVVINISDPTNPGSPVYEDTTGEAYGVYVDGDYAYVADRSSGLAIINISDPTNPGLPVYRDTTGPSYDVWVSGDYAYVADGGSGLAVIDISDPTSPGPPVYEDTTGSAYGVYVSGDFAYVADDTSGLAVIDISNPTNPGTPVYADTTGGADGVYVSGDYVYVAAGDLAIIDISDPTNPGTPVYVDTGSARGVYVSGDYAYVADYYSGLAVIDISDPTNPGTPVYSDSTGSAFGVYVSGDYAYVADWTSGLAVFDISDPTNPGTPVYEDTTGSAYGVYVSGDYAYVADDASGLAIIDISNPTNPGTPVYGYTYGSAYGVYVSGDYAYVADGGRGLAVIDISDPTNPGRPAYDNTDTTGIAEDVYVSGDYAYVADRGSGLAVIQVRKRFDMVDPVITSAPSDFTMESGYTEQSLSWTTTDVNPNTYTIELQGLGIVAGPTAWTSGAPITYNISDGLDVGVYTYTINLTDGYGHFITDNVTITIDDTTDPTINNAPSDFTVDLSYTGQIISWTATDPNPNTYTIDLQGSGIVAGPTTWTSGVVITHNIPDGFVMGDYVYTVNFTDDYGNSITESVTFTVGDTTNPAIINAPSDLDVEYGYTGQSISWTATDLHPGTYTIELQGSGIVAGPTTWTSGVAITYDIQDDLAVGAYIYTVNFIDDYGNNVTESVTFTVEDPTIPTIANAPSDLHVEFGYTGQSISWTATDWDPSTYTIELQGSGIVAGPTTWTSSEVVIYNIPDDFAIGEYLYTVTFTDDYGNFETDTMTFTVEDTTNPPITHAPSDITVELGYTGQSISWTATDLYPHTYTIELQGSGILVGPTDWTSGATITYDIPDGFALGVYVYIVTFTDDYGNFNTDSVTFTVDDTTNPIITHAPNDFTVEFGYTGQSISWTAMDSNSGTYTIELQGSGIVAGPTVWTSGAAITFDIPDGFAMDVYVYTVTFTDDRGNSITDSVSFRVEDVSAEDTTTPIITTTPSDITVEVGYTGQSISWTATDLNPHTYTIELQGAGIVVESAPWTSGIAITYTILNGNPAGVYVYTITFTDDSGNTISDSVTFTVEAGETGNGDDDGGGIPGARFEFILLISLGTIASIIVLVKKRKYRSNVA